MKSSSSETPARETQLLSSASAPFPRLSLQSRELQDEFLRECQNKLGSCGDASESSIVASPSIPSSPLSPLSASSPRLSPVTPSSSPWSSSSSSPSPSPQHGNRSARLSLSSPELLSELKQSRTRSLRHVPAHNGMTTVFSGRGRREASDSTTTQPANQKPSR